jgi:uncharacterized protein (DUF1330 family)
LLSIKEKMTEHKFEAKLNNLDVLKKADPKSPVALIYHIKVKDSKAYKTWCINSSEQLESTSGRRVFNFAVDPVAREGLLIDYVVIDEFFSPKIALEFFSVTKAHLNSSCSQNTVLAIYPEVKLKLFIVRMLASILHFLKGIHDTGVPSDTWKASNTAVWPDEKQMMVAREQNLDSPLLVYNLNKIREIALYQGEYAEVAPSSGEVAYERYNKIAGPLLLRRGAYPVYGGKPIGILYGDDNMLNDNWSKFVLVHYPQRRNLLAMIESDEYKKSQYHRDAGLERVAIFMGSRTNF